MNFPHPIAFRIRLILTDLNIYKGPVLAFKYSVIPPWELPAVTFCWYFPGSKRNLLDSEIGFIFLDHKKEHKNSLSVFTDGSKSNAGVGFGVFLGEFSRKGALPGIASNFAAELIRILLAVKTIATLGYPCCQK